MEQAYIVYSLDKNRTTQKFNRIKYDQILDDIHAFFNNFTTADVNAPMSLQLTAFTPLDHSDPSDQLDDIILNATKLWGNGKISPIAFHYPSGEPSNAKKYEWEITTDKLREAVNYLSNVSMPQSKLDSIQLFITYYFKLLDPTTNRELSNQKYNSIFCVWFSKNKSISPTIFFPFENASQEFWNYIDSISTYLPFKLEEKYLRIAIPNKMGKVNSFKKIAR